MTKEEFLKLKTEFDISVEITQDNVMRKIIEIPKLQSKMLYLFIKEKKKLKNINNNINKIIKELHMIYGLPNDEFKFKLNTVKEIEMHIYGDDRYYKERLNLDSQQIIVDYLEKSLQILNGVSYQIGHYVELLKIKNGYV